MFLESGFHLSESGGVGKLPRLKPTLQESQRILQLIRGRVDRRPSPAGERNGRDGNSSQEEHGTRHRIDNS